MQTAARIDVTARGREVATRRWATAGVALAGASLIAITPTVSNSAVAAELDHDVRAAAVRLTAGFDPLPAWTNTFNTTSANASTLINNFFLAPFVGMQQMMVNHVGYLNTLLNDPSSYQTVLTQIEGNVTKVVTGLPLVNADAATTAAVTAHSVDALHGIIRTMIPTMLPPNIDAATVAALVNFLSSPVSGLMIGAAGPVISPAVALYNSALAIATALQDGDSTTALSDLLDIPANGVNAFFNGATLNLDALTPVLNDSGFLGSTTLNGLDIAFGGLFSVGSVSQGTYKPGGGAAPITTPGGSILNSVGLNVTTELAPGVPVTLDIPGHAVGPIAAMQSISQTIGVLLGDKWDGKNGVPVPPLARLKLPTITPPATPSPAVATTTSAAVATTSAAVATTSAAVATTSAAAAPSTENAGTKTPAKTVVSSAGPAADTTASASTADSGTKDAVKSDPAPAKDSSDAPAPTKPTKPTKQSGDGKGSSTDGQGASTHGQGKGPNSSGAASAGGGTDTGAGTHRKPGHDAGSKSGGSKDSGSSGGSGASS